ncbi:MAG: ATP-dependent DNA helicase [Lachnospiraceae bacterium]|nr:ATP-dependent DNA helicase [Lachnospiraceae bacterium]
MKKELVQKSRQQTGVTDQIRPVIRISVRELVEFILRTGDIDNRHRGSSDPLSAMLEGAKLHRMIQKQMGPDYHAEMLMRFCYPQSDYDILIEGRADGVIFTETESLTPAVIDEIKSTHREPEKIGKPDEVHLAQAKVYAYIFAQQTDRKEIGVRITYANVDTRELKYFHETYTFKEIEKWFLKLMQDYVRWSDFVFSWEQERNLSIKALEFPFDYRAGQKELAAGVYRTIYLGKRLFVEAPTGVGKTVSTVFPTVKAMGEGLVDKIFYLTAKTITRTVALDCFNTLRDGGLKIKTVVITAKEKICPLSECTCNPDACPRAKGHFDRINDAMYDLLSSTDSFDRETVEEYAAKHEVCPFEMSLDMSLFSDGVICDYNYVFDPNVYLRRFFAEGVDRQYAFLIDEAHNLVERGMEMYSAVLIKEQVLEVLGIVKEQDKKLARGLNNTNKQLLALKRDCEEFLVPESISALLVSLTRLQGLLESYLEDEEPVKKAKTTQLALPVASGEKNRDREKVLDLYFQVRHFMNMYENMGEDDYVTYCEHLRDGRFMVKLLCIDPSASLRKCLDKGRSTVFFSATLLPIQYYQNMLSGDVNDYTIYAQSVFDPKKRGLFIANDVSSKYSRRTKQEYDSIAKYILRITSAKKGNYMAFFPSHAFLNEVYTAFMADYYDEETQEVLMQKNTMSEEEREAFLDRFTVENSDKTLIGFCAIGGIFAEGIDLKHDSLIGAIIVGTGLPMVTNERQLLRERYDLRDWDGFDYAYRYPGMNKVMQAAGRVIRTVSDIGIVALLDERFLTGSYRLLFPREWKNYETVNLQTVDDEVRVFWEVVTIGEAD